MVRWVEDVERNKVVVGGDSKQIASLIEIRRNTQSLSLEGNEVESDDDDEKFYNYDELSALAASV